MSTRGQTRAGAGGRERSERVATTNSGKVSTAASLARAHTTDDIERVMSAAHPGTTFAFRGADAGAARRLAAEYDELARSYPQVASEVKLVAYGRDARARDTQHANDRSYNFQQHPDYGEHTFLYDHGPGNRAIVFGDASLSRHAVHEQSAAARRGVDPTAYNMRHEFGHAIEAHLQEHHDDVYRNFVEGGNHRTFDAGNLSRYATFSGHEHFAEAFSAMKYGTARMQEDGYVMALARALHRLGIGSGDAHQRHATGLIL